MQSGKKRYHGNKLVVEAEFVRGNGWYADLVRLGNSEVAFILYEIDSAKIDFSQMVELSNRVVCPPEDDELMPNVRLPVSFGGFKSVADLLQQIDVFLSRC